MKYVYPENLYKKIYSKKFSLYGIYFKKIFTETCKFLNKIEKKSVILDFGCGEGYLKTIYTKHFNFHKIINYDVIPEKSEVKNYNDLKYDIIFASHVFCLFNEGELNNFLIQEIKKNKKVKLIVAIGKQNFFSKFAQIITNKKKANKYNNLNSKQEYEIISKYKKPIFKKNIFYLTDLVVFE